MAAPKRIEILDQESESARITLLAHLAHAPFPFPHKLDRASTDYANSSVLLHVPRHFDPALPARIVLFFHGHHSTLTEQVMKKHLLLEQINNTAKNIILIAPQLADNAVDSHSGKLSRPNGLKKMIDEAVAILSPRLGGYSAADTPILVSAFSGGYRAAADCLAHGGMARQIDGVVLFDALYGGRKKFLTWISDNRDAVFIAFNGDSTSANAAVLESNLAETGRPVDTALPRIIKNGVIAMIDVSTPHWDVPTDGPPRHPLTEILKRWH